jgi:hypothetical protein
MPRSPEAELRIYRRAGFDTLHVTTPIDDMTSVISHGLFDRHRYGDCECDYGDFSHAALKQ